MISIAVKPINSEFIIVWMKLRMRDGHQLRDFKLVQNGKHMTITDDNYLTSLKTDFDTFRLSGYTMEQYFQCNIIKAKRDKSTHFFIPRNIKLTYEKVFFNSPAKTNFHLSQ